MTCGSQAILQDSRKAVTLVPNPQRQRSQIVAVGVQEGKVAAAERHYGSATRELRYAWRVNSNSEISGRAPSRMGKPVMPIPRFM